MTSAIKVVEVSGNAKIGKVSATYATQATCPGDCPLRGSGCYAESGLVGMVVTSKLNRSEDSQKSVDELAMDEAIAIAGLSGEHPLRIHVVGDATTDAAAKMLSDAAECSTSKLAECECVCVLRVHSRRGSCHVSRICSGCSRLES